MKYEQKAWLGGWENFERYIYSNEPAVKLCWAEAEEATQNTPMFSHGTKPYWEMTCNTVNEENAIRLGGWQIEADGENIEIMWTGADGECLGKITYILYSIIAKGLGKKPNFLFEAPNAPEDWPFRYVLAMAPISPRSKRGSSLRYLHFQYASHIENLLWGGDLRKPMWYATMCEDKGTLLDRCNLIRSLHQLSNWDVLPQIDAGMIHQNPRTHTALAKAVHQYLVEHLHQHITIEELARRFGTSPTQLKTSFRSAYGASVQTYHRELKIHAAAKLLRTTNRTVLDIASEFGYANGSKFAAAFQRVMGVTPNEYRTK